MEKGEYEIIKLLLDSNFLDSVFTKSVSSFEWEAYIAANFPDKKEITEKARDIILCQNEDRKKLSDTESHALKSRIFNALPPK